MTKQTTINHNSCTYCGGDGYVHLLLGGSETCHACKGTGKNTGSVK
jgi:hypothetical protein